MNLSGNRFSPPASLQNACFCPKCGLQHSDPAVVGRKSGYPQKANAEISIK
jgi:hypothetical protein